MRRSHTTDNDGAGGVNLTPMLDMAFILLIFFIVTASFTREQGLPLERPSAASGEAITEAPVILTLDARGMSAIDGREMPLSLVRQALARAGAGGAPAQKVVIVADRSLPTATLVQAMDAARLAGVRDLGIATKAPE